MREIWQGDIFAYCKLVLKIKYTVMYKELTGDEEYNSNNKLSKMADAEKYPGIKGYEEFVEQYDFSEGTEDIYPKNVYHKFFSNKIERKNEKERNVMLDKLKEFLVKRDVDISAFEAVGGGYEGFVLEMLKKGLKNYLNPFNPKNMTSTGAELEPPKSAAELPEPYLESSLPRPHKKLIGRDVELGKIHEHLKETWCLFIRGIGGIGKSALALEYANKHMENYDIVIFAVCDNDIKSMILNRVKVRSFTPSENMSDDEKFRKKLKDIKSICKEYKVLFVFDNVENNADCQHLIEELSVTKCKILLTTRDIFPDDYTQFTLDKVDDAYEIFRHYYYKNNDKDKEELNSDEEADVKKILRIYEWHTMLTELFAKYMKDNPISPREVLSKLTKGGLREISDEEHNKDGDFHEERVYGHVRSLFKLAKLDECKILILCNLSLMPPSGVRKDRFLGWCDFSSSDEISDKIKELIRSGWIRQERRRDSDSKLYDMISLHPVIAEVMYDMLEENRAACDAMLQSLSEYIENSMLTGTEETELYLIVHYACDRLCNRFRGDLNEKMIRFICKAADRFHKYGSVGDFFKYLKRACEEQEKISSPSDQVIAELYYVLGLVCASWQRSHDAIKYFEKTLDPVERIYGRNSVELAEIYCQIGKGYCTMSDYAKGEENLNRAFSIMMEAHDTNNKIYVDIYFGLGVIAEQKGDVQTALVYMQEARKYNDKSKDDGDLFELAVPSEIYSLEDQLHVFKAILDWQLKHNGEEHIDTANTYKRLGDLSLDNQDLDDNSGEDNYQKALSIRKRLFGEKDLLTAESYFDLGYWYYQRGSLIKIHRKTGDDTSEVRIAENYNQAKENMETAWEIYKKLNAGTHENAVAAKEVIEEIKDYFASSGN